MGNNLFKTIVTVSVTIIMETTVTKVIYEILLARFNYSSDKFNGQISKITISTVTTVTDVNEFCIIMIPRLLFVPTTTTDIAVVIVTIFTTLTIVSTYTSVTLLLLL